MTYTHYGSGDPLNGVYPTVETRTTSLQCSGCNGAGAWGANIPANGAVVRGITSLSRYVVTGSSLDTLATDWLSGTAVPAEFLMNERAIFTGSISGTTLTVVTMLQGGGNIAVGQTIVGMYANNGMTAATTITGLGTGAGGVGTYTVNNSQTLAQTEIVSGYVAANGISSVSNVDATYAPLRFGLKGQVTLLESTFAGLPACGVAGSVGSIAAVADSNTVTWGANIAGGAGNHVMAYCNGTNWTVMGK